MNSVENTFFIHYWFYFFTKIWWYCMQFLINAFMKQVDKIKDPDSIGDH